MVARGKLYNIGSNIVHGIKLLPGYVKVMTEVPIVSAAPLLISVEYGDVSMVGQAIGTIVLWPFKLTDFVDECQKVNDLLSICLIPKYICICFII